MLHTERYEIKWRNFDQTLQTIRKILQFLVCVIRRSFASLNVSRVTIFIHFVHNNIPSKRSLMWVSYIVLGCISIVLCVLCKQEIRFFSVDGTHAISRTMKIASLCKYGNLAHLYDGDQVDLLYRLHSESSVDAY